MDVGDEQAEQLIARCRLTEAAARLAAMRYDDGGDPEGSRKRLCAGVYALLATTGIWREPSLPSCSHLAAPLPWPHISNRCRASWHRTTILRPRSCSLGDRCRRNLRPLPERARSRARGEALSFAVGARERLAHHAMLFGDLEIAQNALEDALRLALLHRLSEWFSRCAAAAARLALDAGDSERAAQLLARARIARAQPEAIALLAPVGAALAIAAGDDEAVAGWTSPQILETALGSDDMESAVAATVALLSTRAFEARLFGSHGVAEGLVAVERSNLRGRPLFAGGAARRDRRGPPRRRRA